MVVSRSHEKKTQGMADAPLQTEPKALDTRAAGYLCQRAHVIRTGEHVDHAERRAHADEASDAHFVDLALLQLLAPAQAQGEHSQSRCRPVLPLRGRHSSPGEAARARKRKNSRFCIDLAIF